MTDRGHGTCAGACITESTHDQKQQAQQQSAQAQKQGALDTFYRAYGACMEGRGYTVR